MRTYLEDFWLVLGDGRQALAGLVALMLAQAALDLLGLGLIAPLIVAIAGQGDVPATLPPLLLQLATIDLRTVAILVVLVFSVKAVAGFLIQRRLSRFAERHRAWLMERLLRAHFVRPYEYFLQRNSADIVNSVVYTTWTYSTGTLIPSLRLLTDLTMFAVVVGFLLWLNWIVVALLGSVLLASSAVYATVVRNSLAVAGATVTESSARSVQDVNQAVGGVREIRILGVEGHFLDQLRTHARQLADANAQYGALSAVPRYLMEWTLVVGLVSVVLLVSTLEFAPAALITVLGLVAVAAIRLLPGVTSLLGAVSSLRMNRYGLRQLASELRDLPPEDAMHLGGEPPKRLGEFQSLSLDAVTYCYQGATKPAVRNVTFEVLAGQTIGFMGRTGSGKSTTADVLLGLLRPQQGSVRVNGKDIGGELKEWMRRVAYIPQQIHIADDTLVNNVAFGIPPDEVDHERVVRALASARLEKVVEHLPKGVHTVVGERGVRLSGGQRQRVALARAFYHDRDVIVMDEATAALDDETEREVVAAIRELHGTKTLVIIAHRLSTLEGCDVIFQFEDGQIVRRGAFSALVGGRALLGT